ncbi:Gfo/Idh/MocA family protein [Novosphingobium olei]|uniref:Gfo/Idh/MocA family oxidoreductase n=1 Tax=Novosphingobium olei TaxID=2728851 RepID=A0A7Y0G9B5_9SPHN|nr:Gfo/Idh/MocA family oxidoreductase [Novosphingobium olei]NML92858.1 Gfo/Idh/MocA family oxidoreductase [Novosphingobium olei]
MGGMAMEAVRTAVIGLGDISGVYLHAISRSPAVDLCRVASRSSARAQHVGAQFDAEPSDVASVLADPSIEMVVNLTPAIAHDDLNEAIISAGKHLYSEKPFALSKAVASGLAASAARKGVLVGSAPDTLYGSVHQAARRAVDQGAIGREVFGMSFIGLPGLEMFHPNPSAFYRPGGEPPFDVGPYYIAMWINLLGPVRRVHATSASGQDMREVRRGPLAGTRFAVQVDTTFNAILEFETASVSLVLSLDVVTPTLRPGELFGSVGSLALADPMFFSGSASLTIAGSAPQPLDTTGLPFAEPNRRNHLGVPVADYRGVGLIDLALAIRTGRANRKTADFIVHSVEVMEAIAIAARTRHAVDLTTTCARPEPLDPVDDAALIALTASPFDFDPADAGH